MSRRRRSRPPRARPGACAARRAASCTARRASCSSRSASTSIGTPLSASAVNTSRWWGVSDGPAPRRAARAAARRPRGARARTGRRAASCGHVSSSMRDLAALPRAPARLHARLEQRELVRPGREAARAAEGVELAEDRHQRVVGGLRGEVVDVARGEVASCPRRRLSSKRAARSSSACSSASASRAARRARAARRSTPARRRRGAGRPVLSPGPWGEHREGHAAARASAATPRSCARGASGGLASATGRVLTWSGSAKSMRRGRALRAGEETAARRSRSRSEPRPGSPAVR